MSGCSGLDSAADPRVGDGAASAALFDFWSVGLISSKGGIFGSTTVPVGAGSVVGLSSSAGRITGPTTGPVGAGSMVDLSGEAGDSATSGIFSAAAGIFSAAAGIFSAAAGVFSAGDEGLGTSRTGA